MEKRIVPQLKGINDYYDQPYNEIYRSVVDIAKDVRRMQNMWNPVPVWSL